MVSGQVCLRRGEEARVRSGAPWIFENELDWADDTCETGGIVDVLDSRLRFCARILESRLENLRPCAHARPE